MIIIFRYVTLCHTVDGYQCVRGMWWLHLQAATWRWRQQVAPKCLYPSNKLQGITFLKTIMLTLPPPHILQSGFCTVQLQGTKYINRTELFVQEDQEQLHFLEHKINLQLLTRTQGSPGFNVLIATGVVLFHRPSHTSPNCPCPNLRTNLRELRSISHWSRVLWDRPLVIGFSICTDNITLQPHVPQSASRKQTLKNRGDS